MEAEKLNRYKKLGKNIALITIGNFASKILSFLLIPFYTAVLTTSEYGIADLMTTTINLISPFFTLLISEAIMRFALEKGIKKSQVFTIGLITTLLGFVAMVLFSPLILFIETLKPFYWLFLCYYLAVTLHSMASQFVKGLEKISIYSISGVIHTFIFILLNLLFLLGVKMGVEGYLLALVISNFIVVIFLWIAANLNHYILPIKKIDWQLARDMFRYSIPMIPNSISWWISNSSDKYILTFFSGVALTGVYSVSQKIPSLFATISTIFMGAWQISAVEDFGSEQSRKFYTGVYRKYSSLNIILVSILIWGTKILAAILFSKDFYSAWMFTPVLLLAFLFNSMASFLGSIYTSAKKTKMLFISTVIAALVNIIANFIMIPLWGAMGAGIATLLSYFLIWIIRLIDTAKIIKIDVDLRKDIISYLFLVIQIIILCMNIRYSYAFMSLILIIILFIHKGLLISVLSMIKNNREKHKGK